LFDVDGSYLQKENQFTVLAIHYTCTTFSVQVRLLLYITIKGCDSNFDVNILKVATNETSTLH